MSWWKQLYKFFRKQPKPLKQLPTPAQLVQDIRNAIPAACETKEGLQKLRVVIARYTGQDQEMFNAINRILPKITPSSAGDFSLLDQTCDAIDDGIAREQIIGILKVVDY